MAYPSIIFTRYDTGAPLRPARVGLFGHAARVSNRLNVAITHLIILMVGKNSAGSSMLIVAPLL